MPTKQKKKAKPVNVPPAVAERRPASLWSLHGMEDVYFQREAQVNFWTVMGGLDAAALLTQTGILWEQMQAGRWQLGMYFLNSALIIVLGWTLLSWGSLVLKYPITIPSFLLIFLSNFALAIQCLLVTKPAGWLAATAVAGLFNWLHQIYFYRSGAWEPFPAKMIKHLKANLWVYGLWPLVCIVATAHLYLAPSTIAETAWGVISLVVIIDALFRQHRGMQREKKELGIP